MTEADRGGRRRGRPRAAIMAESVDLDWPMDVEAAEHSAPDLLFDDRAMTPWTPPGYSRDYIGG